jgi:hypothetical protein
LFYTLGRYIIIAGRWKDITVAVIDGMGGGIGVRIISEIRKMLGEEVEIMALGTNAVATE